MSEIEPLQNAIDMLEAQRSVLGDAVVDAALAPLLARMQALTAGIPAEHLREPSGTQPDSAQSEDAVTEERRLVSVLFADLVDFTPMTERTDPEDMREVLRMYFDRWTSAIQMYGGVVEKFIGDAVMAVFGLHAAREDDAERAVRAALEMRSELEALKALTGGKLAQVVIDATGSNKSMGNAYHFVGFTGRLVFVGITTSEITFTHPLMHRREMSFLASRNAMPEDFTRIIHLIETGKIDTRPWITHRSRFDALIENFPSYTKPETGVIKAVVEVS